MKRVFHALTSHKPSAVVAGLLVAGVVAAVVVVAALTSSSSGGVSAEHGSPTRVAPAGDPAARTTITTATATTITTETATTIAPAPGVTTPPPGLGAPGIVVASAHFDLPDPFILRDAGTYYLYVSTPFGATELNVAVLWGGPGHWVGAKDVLPILPPWALKQFTWTPAVYRFGSSFVLYFASVTQAWPSLHCIGIATSTSPLGPFIPGPTPLVCHPEHGGDIDPQVLYDPAGPNGPANPYYLIWKADSNSTPALGLVPTFWAQTLSNDGTTVTGHPTEIYWPRQQWQRDLLEAPQMVNDPSGRLWLFYSAGGIFNSPTYAMGFAACNSPLGPCYDTTSVPLISSNRQGVGPGEETVFQGSDASTWLLYNPWSAGQWFNWVRPAEGARIVWLQSGPAVGVPGSFPPP